jgi:hypothetical protein
MKRFTSRPRTHAAPPEWTPNLTAAWTSCRGRSPLIAPVACRRRVPINALIDRAVDEKSRLAFFDKQFIDSSLMDHYARENKSLIRFCLVPPAPSWR